MAGEKNSPFFPSKNLQKIKKILFFRRFFPKKPKVANATLQLSTCNFATLQLLELLVFSIILKCKGIKVAKLCFVCFFCEFYFLGFFFQMFAFSIFLVAANLVRSQFWGSLTYSFWVVPNLVRSQFWIPLFFFGPESCGVPVLESLTLILFGGPKSCEVQVLGFPYP